MSETYWEIQSQTRTAAAQRRSASIEQQQLNFDKRKHAGGSVSFYNLSPKDRDGVLDIASGIDAFWQILLTSEDTGRDLVAFLDSLALERTQITAKCNAARQVVQ